MAIEVFELIQANNRQGKETLMIIPYGPVGPYRRLSWLVNRYRLSLQHGTFINMDDSEAVNAHEGLQDMRAMQLLQTLTSRDEVLELLDDCLGTTGFRDSPHSDTVLLHLREKINQMIAERTERPDELNASVL